jgi:predicted RNase H-like nuclease
VLVLGIDLAWATKRKQQAETGVAALAPDGTVVDAGWTVGIGETIDWIQSFGDQDLLAFVDAPLIVTNPAKTQRACEKQVGQGYGRWKVSCNSTNIDSPNLGGIELLRELFDRDWRYDDGFAGPPSSGRVVSECYPYTALVGVAELGYEVERPLYKRKPRGLRVAEWRPMRARNCDELISRLVSLQTADPPLRLESNSITHSLLTSASPIAERDYKHREDLIDALLCAWSGQLWLRHGFARSQVLGLEGPEDDWCASIIAPTREVQRRGPTPL